MDGVLPTEKFNKEEELVSLTHEHKILKEKYEILKEKYENHPEVLELIRLQDELKEYQNFYKLGEREELLEEIQNLRDQLQSYTDLSSTSSNKKNDSSDPSLSATRISLSEELRAELEFNKSLVEKMKQELETEKRCVEELNESMHMAIQGHGRLLEQYADLEEKHVQLLSRHRRIQEGMEDVKKAAAKAGVRGAESKFINSLAGEISALKLEREKERQILRDEIKGLQAQLKNADEAAQVAGARLGRIKEAEEGLKEAEEALACAQKRATEAEQEAAMVRKQIDKLKKKHKKEIRTLNELLDEARLPKEGITQPANDDGVSAENVLEGE